VPGGTPGCRATRISLSATAQDSSGTELAARSDRHGQGSGWLDDAQRGDTRGWDPKSSRDIRAAKAAAAGPGAARALTGEFHISGPTVVRALRMLRQDGWIETPKGKGSFVRGHPAR